MRFWLAVLLTGAVTGLGAAALTRLLELIQRIAWRGSATDILEAAQHASAARHVLVLLAGGAVVGLGYFILKRVTSANGIETTAAIWLYAGRLPAVRTLGSAVLSIFAVGMGASLGREGAPKQAGAVIANWFSDRGSLSDEQRRLLVACGVGAGMGAAYGVPLGGALFALEVMRGKLALRYVLPAVFASMIATGVSWLSLPNAPTYIVPQYESPAYGSSLSVMVWAVLAAPIIAIASVGYIRMVRWADRNKPTAWRRFVVPVVAMGIVGLVSIRFPQILGNGKDISQLLFTNQVAPFLMLALLALKPAATALCMRGGIPGGLFTPSLTAGALLGAVLGHAWGWIWPGVSPGLFALLGAGAVVAATTQGPVSAVVLLMELTGRSRSFILPLLIICTIATLIARSIEPRSIYDAKLTDEEVAERQRLREESAQSL
jgi:H+/Cl- antiporter ClcA